MKYLSVDFGLKRTGIAAAEAGFGAGEGMAFPRRTLVRKNRDQFWKDFDALMAVERPDALVVGLPRLADGADGDTALHVRAFVKELKRRFSLPVFQADERLSSFEAEQDLREFSALSGRSQSRDTLDQQAAVRILESFLGQAESERSLFP